METHNKPLTIFVSAVVAIVFALVSLISASRQHDNLDERVFSFALWGDTPYSDVEKTTKIPALIQDINNSGSVFSVFDGDIKSGSSRCDDVVYAEAVARFNTFDRPMIYVPGDNEWTDCHRTNNGGFNALERLTFLRLTLFASPQSFGQKTLLLEHQDQYPENTRWTFGDVVFVGLNVPGSNNNKVHPGQCVSNKSARTLADCDADNIEYAARDAANIRFLNDRYLVTLAVA
jgi:hypothetical protein